MPYLKAKNQREALRLLGVQLPERVHAYLALYATAHGMRKTDLFKDLLYNWIDDQKEIQNEAALVQKIIDRTYEEWKKIHAKHRLFKFSRFKGELEQELLKKGIKPEYVKSIMEQVG